ncbi:CASP-like protein [Rhynchospora pubera]|uniref:CASP-like protein n=1 Tax=Rhynchospora pubera TaxID=906938 RepID=A0AAV8HC57_9POAL|nr:CASP-like protein [Rhynchospora pubera]
MAELTQSPLAPHNTPEKCDHPPPPAAIAAHAARREPVRPADGWYAWAGEDLPRDGNSGRVTAHSGGVRNAREVTDERDARDEVRAPRRDGTGQGFWSLFGSFKGANFTQQTQAGLHQPDKDNLPAGIGHTATPPEATRSDLTDPSRVITRIMQREQNAAAVRRAALAARVAAMVFSIVAFSVLAADRNKGWARDSYNKYSQFRYCETVNVIGFLYSGLQLYALIHYKRNKKHIIRRPLGDYLDFIMDQVLAYLLISASSSATARVRDWVVNWGSDPFPNMANGSIAITFLAFLACAVSSLLSAYNLFSKTF